MTADRPAVPQDAPRCACVVNPKTGRAFTKHRYRQEGLRVKTYTQMYSGEMAPTRFAFELVCERCGRTVPCEY